MAFCLNQSRPQKFVVRDLVTLGKFKHPKFVALVSGRWADPLGDAIKAARAWCRGGDADAAEKEPLVAADRSSSRGDGDKY